MLGNHLLGLYEKALDPADPWSVRLDKAARLGFDFVELSIDESDVRLARLAWSRAERAALRQASWDSGVMLRSMCLSAHRRFPFGSADPAVRARAWDIMEQALTLAEDLGIRVIQLAGYDVYYEPSTPESVRLFRQAMLRCAKLAEQHQVMLAVEVMDTPFLNSISKYMAYEGMVRSPWFRVYPDLGNLSAWPENDVDFELTQGIGSIVAVHLKDTVPPEGGKPGVFKCVPFGSGCVDFPRRFRQLEELGYTGPYLIEMWADKDRPDLETVSAAKDWLETQFRAGLAERKAQ